MAEADTTSSVFQPDIYYRDPKAALSWLERAFGFETSLVVEDADGNIGYSEMRFGEGSFGVGGEWQDETLIGPALMSRPLSVGRVNTQAFEVELHTDIDGH
jgi:uncharacterized glyoxalase superfamily protein PhnB